MEFKETEVGFIPDHWEVMALSEYTDFVTDYVANGSFASLKENVEYNDNPDHAILIRLVDYNNSFKGPFKYVNQRGYEYLKKTKLFGGEIVIANVGANIGTVFKVPELNYPMTLGPNSITFKTKGIDDFYYYWFLSRKGYGSIQSISSGSAQPKFNKTDFKKLKIPVPPKHEQKNIANALNSFEEKISINNQIISNLEELAQTLFKRWFVDFEFPNEDGEPYRSSGGKMVESELGLIPEGWEVRTLDEIANYQNGLAMQKFPPESKSESLPVIKIKELNKGSTDANSNRCSEDIKESVKVKDGDVLFSWSGTLLVKLWMGGPAGLNQHLFKVTSDNYPKWLYYYWTLHHLRQFTSIAQDKATTMGHIKRSHLKEAKVVVPSFNEKINYFDAHMSPLIEKIIETGVENKKNVALRDILLPKLLSGEIELSEETGVDDDVVVP